MIAVDDDHGRSLWVTRPRGRPLARLDSRRPRLLHSPIAAHIGVNPCEEILMTDIVIASAARTPVGAFNGGLASLPAHKLGEVAIAEVLRRANVEPKDVSEVILGQILSAGEGMKIGRAHV